MKKSEKIAEINNRLQIAIASEKTKVAFEKWRNKSDKTIY